MLQIQRWVQMIDEYHISNYVSFFMNKIACSLHKRVTSQMDVFAVLDDCETTNELNLVWDVSEENRVRVFKCLCDEEFADNVNIEQFVDIFKFMNYMGFSSTLTNRVVSKLTQDAFTFEQFVEHFKHYDDSNETRNLFNRFIPTLRFFGGSSGKNNNLQSLIYNFSPGNRLYIITEKLKNKLDHGLVTPIGRYIHDSSPGKIRNIMQRTSKLTNSVCETCWDVRIESLTLASHYRGFDYHFCTTQNMCAFFVNYELICIASHSDKESADKKATVCCYVASLITKTKFPGIRVCDLCEESFDTLFDDSTFSSDDC